MSMQALSQLEQPPGAPSPRRNQLLAALPAADYERLQPKLEFAPLPLRWVVYASDKKSSHVYFPTSGIISMRCVTINGLSDEIATTGREGLVGTALFLRGETMPFRAVVQNAGYAYRLEASTLTSEFENGGALLNLALRHTLALIAEIGQTAVCSRLHSMEQQLCRSILWALDRLDSNELAMTHKLISNNLGVRRECVTRAVARLHRTGLIDCHRGRITVLDRSKLEARTCECYGAVKREYGCLLDPKLLELGQARRGTRTLGPARLASVPRLSSFATSRSNRVTGELLRTGEPMCGRVLTRHGAPE